MSQGGGDNRMDLHQSISLGADEVQRRLRAKFGAGDIEVNSAILSERSPSLCSGQQHNTLLKEKTDMLFPQFLEVLQARTNDSEVFDTIQDLIHTCAAVLGETQKDYRYEEASGRGGGGVQRASNVVWLEQELKTWKLLYALYKDRIMLQGEGGVVGGVGGGDGAGMDCDDAVLGGSEKEVIAQLYTSNAMLREHQLIVDWLEACYDAPDVGPRVGHTTDRTVGWENTLFQLKSQHAVAFGSGAEIVKSLDPDAPVREKRPLHSLDEEDNQRLARCIFTEIRRGRIDEAMALCRYCGQTWRAAILEGWRLHDDPNYDETQQQTSTRQKLPIDGNPRRDVWKKCAWMMADSKRYDEYTRAIAGAFCGHLEALKGLLGNSWEDLLWSHLKVQIDIRVETEIRTCCVKNYYQMPEAYWNGKMSLDQIFSELAVQKDTAVRDHAGSKLAIIQKHLMLDNIRELLELMEQWVNEPSSSGRNQQSQKESGSPMTPHMQRFLTHIVLFMRQIGRVDKEDTADRIIAAYVESLITLGDAQLVAFYTAALPSNLQVTLYAKFLAGIEDVSARSTALEEAINAGLDVETITRHTVQSIRQLVPSQEECERQAREPLNVGAISPFDRRKIHALGWLSFLPTQRGELLWQANAMIRIFLGESKPECVRAAYAQVTRDTISHIIGIYGAKENLPCREECSVKEYLSYKVYLAALESFEDWSRLYHNRPKEPELVEAGANFTERVASEHKKQVYYAELNRWQSNLEEQTKVSRDALFNILLFPENGWLLDPDTQLKKPVGVTPTDWQGRQVQLEKLRSICIPDVVLLLYKVLHLSNDHKGCVLLAEELASESRQLYKVYTKHKLAELLFKLAESSLLLLNEKVDPWGFPVTA